MPEHSSPAPSGGALASAGGSASRVPPEMGEPYDLLGPRLHFQNWHYINPGAFDWTLPSGKRVGLADSVAPGEARLVRRDQPYGIRLVAQPAARLGPLFEAGRPWEEGAGVALTTVIRDGGVFRGWGAPFTTSANPPGQKHFVYYESADGLTWRRPDLGLVDWNGSRANNIVNIFGAVGGSVFIDPSAPAAERFKLIAEMTFSREVIEDYLRRRPNDWDPKAHRRSDGTARGLCGGVSPDGLHWTQFREPLAVEFTDTQVTGYYDPRLRRYVAYTRTWTASERSRRALAGTPHSWSSSRRAIGRSESDSFGVFPVHDTILEPGPDLLPTDALYTNGKTAMPGAPDHHLLFPTVWHTFSDSTSVAVASSSNGKNWHFLPGSPVFQTAPFGAFDGGCLFAHPNLLELSDGRLALPYTGYNVPHKYPRPQWRYAPGYMIWPKGRIIALEAPGLGEFRTVALMAPGRRLRINAVIKRGGCLRMEVAGINGDPLPGRSFAESTPLSGDLFWTQVTWQDQEDLGYPDGSAIALRFRMDQAQLYGLEFA